MAVVFDKAEGIVGYKNYKDYKERVLLEMRKMSAKEEELVLVTDDLIEKAVSGGHEPEDVAWALLFIKFLKK